mgnify:CR=1 FL=1
MIVKSQDIQQLIKKISEFHTSGILKSHNPIIVKSQDNQMINPRILKSQNLLVVR